MAQSMKTLLQTLLKDRDTKREEIQQTSDFVTIRNLTTEIVAKKNRGEDASELVKTRDSLKETLFAGVNELGAQISALRRQIRAAEHLEQSADYEKFSDEELATERANLDRGRKELKKKQRAIQIVLNKRNAEKTTDDLLAKLNPEELAALKSKLK